MLVYVDLRPVGFTFDNGLTVEKDKEKDKKFNKLVISDDVTNLTRSKSLFCSTVIL